MDAQDRFPRVDAFQQVIFTSTGAIDVIATDQAARRHNARLLATGIGLATSALRHGLARLLRALAARLDADQRLPAASATS